ncbi:MAG TPA: hypothetical protein VKT77_12545, partial [Chthonomonadaceae bacterium]|nr:hypothetical protein [Chthonomonadaceae bacterium]
WDNAPYLPVGEVFAARSLDNEGDAAFHQDVAALEALKAHGIRDIVVAPTRSLAEVPPAALQRLVSYLDGADFRYGLTFGKGISRPLVGIVVRPTVYRYFEKDAVTATWQVSNTDAGLFAMVDADGNNRLLRADYVAVNSTVVTLPLEVDPSESAPSGRVFAHFYPHKAIVGDNTLPDVWGGFDDYRDRLLALLAKVKFGKGLRFFQDPLARHLGLAGETDYTVPDSSAFRLEWEAFLTQRYSGVERARDAWSIADADFKSLSAMAYLVPLWEKTHGMPYFFNPADGKKIRIVDASRSRWWSDFLEFRDASIQYYMNTMADLLKQQAANVPIVYTWTQTHPIFLNRERAGGFDGLVIPARGAASTLLSRTLIPGYSHVEQADRALWCIASEIDAQPSEGGARSAAARGAVLASAPPGTPGPAPLAQSLDGIRLSGVKGFFVGALPGASDDTSPPAGLPDAALESLHAYAARFGAEPAVANYAPQMLFYPQSAPGPARSGPIPGSNVLWAGSYKAGETLDWWPSYSGYSTDNNQEAVLISLQGRRETHIWVPRPKDIEAYTPEGTPVPFKTFGKNCIIINLDSTPTVFRTGGQKLLLQEAAQDVMAQLEGLYTIAQNRKLAEAATIRNVSDTIERYYAERGYENAYQLALGKVNELTAIIQPYIWIEGERASAVNMFDEVARNPEASNGSYLTLFNHNAPPQKFDKYGYGVYYSVDAPKDGLYTLWLAGSLPAPNVSPILWRVDAPPDMPVADASAHGPKYLGDRFGWMLLGQARLTAGAHTLMIFAPERAVSPNVYSFSIDALMITQGAFHPNGAIRPVPVDASELKQQKLDRPKKKDPPTHINRNPYPDSTPRPFVRP